MVSTSLQWKLGSFPVISLGSGRDDVWRAHCKETNTMVTFSGIPVLSDFLVEYLIQISDYPICSSIEHTLNPKRQRSGPVSGTNRNMAEWCPGRVPGLIGEKDLPPGAHKGQPWGFGEEDRASCWRDQGRASWRRWHWGWALAEGGLNTWSWKKGDSGQRQKQV